MKERLPSMLLLLSVIDVFKIPLLELFFHFTVKFDHVFKYFCKLFLHEKAEVQRSLSSEQNWLDTSFSEVLFHTMLFVLEPMHTQIWYLLCIFS